MLLCKNLKHYYPNSSGDKWLGKEKQSSSLVELTLWIDEFLIEFWFSMVALFGF